MIGLSIALIIIVLIILYSLVRTAGESDRKMEQIREQLLLRRAEMERLCSHFLILIRIISCMTARIVL